MEVTMSERRDILGEECKAFELVETDRRAEIGKPIYIRIDGARFSRFTRGMDRPFDVRMSKSMVETTKAIMQDYHALIGYTQSDEISLVFFDAEHETHHGGKYQKIVSRLASKATSAFTRLAVENGLSEFVSRQAPEFDARAYSLPSLDDAARVLLWRELDATKNAVSMAARALYSHKKLHGKNAAEMLNMIAEKGIVFNDYPAFFTKGTFVRRVTELRELSEDELARIPEKHRPTEPVLRHRLVELDLPPLARVEDLTSVLFWQPEEFDALFVG
jgi:tRNA(His) 5'-end guanylyltransferase